MEKIDGFIAAKLLSPQSIDGVLKSRRLHQKRDTSVQDLIQDAVNSGKPIEIDSVGIVRKEDYVMPPFVKGYISVDGLVPLA
jgi:hypothetical protein|eukprot:SAG25_NODE_2501_length_1566_cov_1.918882_3_plen_82_part_00